MEESRAEKAGRFLGEYLDYVIDTFPSVIKEEYRSKFLIELRKYSFLPRKKGAPKNEGCNWELKGLEHLSVHIPEEVARLHKELMHLTYLKATTSRRIMKGLLKYFNIEME